MKTPRKCEICHFEKCDNLVDCDECLYDENDMMCKLSRRYGYDHMEQCEFCACDRARNREMINPYLRIRELESENLQLHKQLDDWRKNGYKTSRIKY